MKGEDGHEVQSTDAVVGAAPKADGAVAFVAAYWAWLRGERDHVPEAEDYGLTIYQAAAIGRQITMTDEYRRMRK